MSQYRTAVSLSYNGRTDSAPSVECKGEHLMADTIVRTAHRFGVPVVERADLARALASVEVDSTIPPSLYRAVAILLDELRITLESQGKSSNRRVF